MNQPEQKGMMPEIFDSEKAKRFPALSKLISLDFILEELLPPEDILPEEKELPIEE